MIESAPPSPTVKVGASEGCAVSLPDVKFPLHPIVDSLDEREVADALYDIALDVEDAVNFDAESQRKTTQHPEGVPNPVTPAKYRKQDKKQRLLEFDASGEFLGYPKIPGNGVPNHDCGNFVSLEVCTQCGYKKPRKKSCCRPACPICWKDWVSREAHVVEDKLNGFKKAYKTCKGRRLGNPSHVVASPPPDEGIEILGEKNGYSKLRTLAKDKLKEAGMRGGSTFVHPYRVKQEYKEKLYAASLAQPGERKKKFWELIGEDVLNLGSWHEYAVLSPHAHGICHGTLDPKKVKEIYDKTGWVVKVIRHVSGDGEAAALAYYLLTHVGVVAHRKTVTWFGSMGYNQLEKTYSTTVCEEVSCPLCGGDMIVYYPDTGVVIPLILEKTTWEYRMKGKTKCGK